MADQEKNEAVETEQVQDPAAILRKGVIALMNPLLAADKEVKELAYDFTALTNREYTAAMDSDPANSSLNRISHKQALELFIKAAKGNPGLDERDLRERLSMPDAMVATKVAAGFFVHMSLVTGGRIRSQ